MCHSRHMNTENLKQAMIALGLSKSELARLLGVTLRAVSMWDSGDREIPGPAVAYLRLLQSIPKALQAKEFAQLSKGNPMLYDGMYLVKYTGRDGEGATVLVFIDGIVFGHDGGVQYDGAYAPSPNESGSMDLQLCLTVPPGVALVQGVPAQPAEYRFEIRIRLPARANAPINVQTPYGPVVGQLSFLRPLPSQLAA